MSPNDREGGVLYEGAERRANHHLRDLFDRAYEVAEPLLDLGHGPRPGGSAHFLRIVLHETFPELHQQDVAILSVAIERVFRERHRSASE